MCYSVFSHFKLSYNELRKRDVINVPDGRCLGRIIDLRLSFPSGVMVGIVVPGRKSKGICHWFDKTEFYIDRSRIIKIGGDVILVDISCECKPPKPPHKQPCKPPNNCGNNDENHGCNIFSETDIRIDQSDY